jgi:hypothetical protein
MILGLSLAAFTYLHVAISLIAIAAGLVVIVAMIGAKKVPAVTALFLVTTVLTSLTGFLFPFKGITPGIVVGILSMIVLLLAIVALYVRGLAHAWRAVYVVSSALALYFNVFVFIVQSFEKVPALKALAPTQTEAPFKIAQLATLLLFIGLTIAAFRRFRIEPSFG